MNHHLKKTGTVSAIVALTLIPFGVTARTVPASIGKAVVPADNACFSSSSGSIRNSCATAKSFDVPLPVDNAGGKTVHVAAYGATSANNVGCIAVGVNRELTITWASQRMWLSGFGGSRIITLTGANVPNSGYLYVHCTVNPGGRVNNVDYNP